MKNKLLVIVTLFLLLLLMTYLLLTNIKLSTSLNQVNTFDSNIIDENTASNAQYDKLKDEYTQLQEEYNKILNDLNTISTKKDQLCSDSEKIKQDYEGEISRLNEKIKELEINEKKLNDEIFKQKYKSLDFSIFIGESSLELFAYEDDVDKILGSSEEYKYTINEDGVWDYLIGTHEKIMSYNDSMVWFLSDTNGENFRATEYSISYENATTPRGLKIGDSIEKLKSLYPLLSEINTDGEYRYEDMDNLRYFMFKVSDSKVVKINLGVIYD